MKKLSRYLKSFDSFLSSNLHFCNYGAIRSRLQDVAGLILNHNLFLLASIYRSDKGTIHDYVALYSKIFQRKRLEKLIIFEIGIGGYSDPCAGGESLRMWSRFFPNSVIVGIDYYRKTLRLPRNVYVEQADQSSCSQLKHIVDKYGPPDIVIDDGSHYSDHVRESFSCLFPFLRDGGFYCIEDLHTSYWPSGFCDNNWEGSLDIYSKSTSVAMVKRCIDSLNILDMIDAPVDVLASDGSLSSVYCSRGLAILEKNSPFVNNKPRQHVLAMRNSSSI